MTSSNIRGNAGFTLIETTVAMLLLAFGMLGLAHMQTSSIQFSQESQHRTTINNQIADMIDRMRANGVSALDGGSSSYTTDISLSELTTTTCAATNNSTPLIVSPRIDTICFYVDLASTLPGAMMEIDTVSLDGDASQESYRVRVYWNDRQITNASLDSDSDAGDLTSGDCAGLNKIWSGTLAYPAPAIFPNPNTCLTRHEWFFEVITRT